MMELPSRGRAAPQSYKESSELEEESESEEKNVTVKRTQPARRGAAAAKTQQVIESTFLGLRNSSPFLQYGLWRDPP